MSRFLVFFIIYPIAALSLLATMACMASMRVKTSWLWAITGAGLFASIVRLVVLGLSDNWGIDHRIFWDAGADIWAGMDPYAPDRFPMHPLLNPPSTFPIFALIAALPYRISLVLWSVLNSGLAFSLVPLAAWVLNIDDDWGKKPLSRAELGVMATAVALSDACMMTLLIGQLSLIATVLILLAMAARQRCHPLGAGTLLALATMKIGTMLPFLLLFARRRDAKSWLALGLTVIGLIALGGHPTRILDDCHAMLSHISDLSRPGAVNDISLEGPQSHSIVGLEHLAYRLGVRNDTALKLIQGGVLLLLGLWLAAELVTRRVSFGLGLSLVSLYSTVFLYHRIYDTVIIVPAFVYAVARARTSSGREKWLYVMSTLLMLTLLYARRNTLVNLTHWAALHRGPNAMLIRWFILPHATWSVLIAMACLRLAHAFSIHSTPVAQSIESNRLSADAG